MAAITSSVPFFSSSTKGDVLVRVQLLTGNTTVVPANSEMKMWDMLILICEKKEVNQLEVQDMKVVFDGGKEMAVDMSKILSFYANKFEKIVLVGKPVRSNAVSNPSKSSILNESVNIQLPNGSISQIKLKVEWKLSEALKFIFKEMKILDNDKIEVSFLQDGKKIDVDLSLKVSSYKVDRIVLTENLASSFMRVNSAAGSNLSSFLNISNSQTSSSGIYHQDSQSSLQKGSNKSLSKLFTSSQNEETPIDDREKFETAPVSPVFILESHFSKFSVLSSKSPLKAAASLRRRGSVMPTNVESKVVVRSNTQEFPITLTDPTDLSSRINAKLSAGGTYKNKIMKNLGRSLFKKDSFESTGSNADISMTRHINGASDTLTWDTDSKSSSPSNLIPSFMLSSQDSDSRLDSTSMMDPSSSFSLNETTLDLESQHGSTPEMPQIPDFLSKAQLPPLPNDATSISAENTLHQCAHKSNSFASTSNESVIDIFNTVPTDGVKSVHNVTGKYELHSKARKRTLSTPLQIKMGFIGRVGASSFHIDTPPEGKNQIQSCPVRESVSMISPSILQDSIVSSLNLPSQKSVKITFLIPNLQTPWVQDSKFFLALNINQPMELIFLEFCTASHINFELYSLNFYKKTATNDSNAEAVLMDKPLTSYLQDPSATTAEFAVVAGKKKYETICVSENDNDVMILRNVENSVLVMAGTVDKLIIRATDPEEKQDTDFLDTLLMSFRSYMTPLEFLDSLLSRFYIELGENPCQEDILYFTKVIPLIQKKCLFCLKWWMENHWHDFGLCVQLRTELAEFVESLNEFPHEALDLSKIMTIQTKMFNDIMSTTKSVDTKGKALESMILELDPEDISQQLCLLNYNLFKNIHPIEFLNKIWVKNGEDPVAPSLEFFISRFDKESYWVATEICKKKDMKTRTLVLKNFILTAKKCEEANNYFSMFSLIAGLNLSPVHRLKKTWENLPEKVRKVFAELEKMIDPSKNMKNFRERIAGASPPLVPFIPLYLKDLTFMNDGNQSKVKNMINFDKLRMMSNRVKDIKSLAKTQYKFKPNSQIQNYLLRPPLERSLTKLKEFSKECEKQVVT